MKITLWSAGKNGKIAKERMLFSLTLIALWVAALIAIAANGPYIEYSDYTIAENMHIMDTVIVTLLFMCLTFFLPFIEINMAIRCSKALNRNVEFNLEIIKHTELDKLSNLNTNMIVFGDKEGIVVTDNLQAYNDWNCFYSINTTYDLYELKHQMDKKLK